MLNVLLVLLNTLKIGARVLAMGVMSHNTGRGRRRSLRPATVTFDPGKTRELFDESVQGWALSDMSHCVGVLHIHPADKEAGNTIAFFDNSALLNKYHNNNTTPSRDCL